MFKLIIEDDEGHTTVVPMIKDEITIGRKEGNTIRLTERNVSRHHARLLKSSSSVFIEDLDSYNGVKVNGDRITARTSIREGDLVEIGDYHFAIQWVGEEATKVAAPPHAAPEVPPPLQARAAPSPSESQAALLKLAVTAKPEAEPGVRPVPEGQIARLLALSTELAGTEYVLNRSEMVLGRTDECEIFVNHRSVSNRHAKIAFDSGVYRIVDLESANGVLVNGEQYSRVDLRKGDVIEVGLVRLRYLAPGEEYQTINEIDVIEDGPTLVDKGAGVKARAVPVKQGKKTWLALGVIIVVSALGFLVYQLTRPKPPPGTSLETPQPRETAVVKSPQEPTEDSALEVPAPDELAANHYKEGMAKLKQREFDGAIAAFTAALEMSAEYPGAAAMLTKAKSEKSNGQLFEKAKDAMTSSNYDEAWDLISQIPGDSMFAAEVAEIRPKVREKYISFHLNKAAKFRDAGEMESAMKEVDSVLIIDEKNAYALNLKKTIGAMPKTKKVAILEPPPVIDKKPKVPKEDPAKKKKEAKDLVDKGVELTRAKKFVDALNAFMKAIQIDPKNCEALVDIGIVYATTGKSDRAAQYYQKFIDACPKHPKVPQVRAFLKQFYEYRKTR